MKEVRAMEAPSDAVVVKGEEIVRELFRGLWEVIVIALNEKYELGHLKGVVTVKWRLDEGIKVKLVPTAVVVLAEQIGVQSGEVRSLERTLGDWANRILRRGEFEVRVVPLQGTNHRLIVLPHETVEEARSFLKGRALRRILRGIEDLGTPPPSRGGYREECDNTLG